MEIKLFNAEWGYSDICVDFNKIDFLPRITASSLQGSFLLNIGFLMLTFNFFVYSSDMREFNKKMKSGEFLKDAIEVLEGQYEQQVKREQQQADNIKHISEVVDQIMIELKKKKPRYKKRFAEQ